MADRVFCVFPSSTNKVAFENNLDFNYVQDDNLLGVLEIDFNGICNLKAIPQRILMFIPPPILVIMNKDFKF